MDPTTEGGDIAAAVTRPAEPQPPLHTTHHCSQEQQEQQDNDREAEGMEAVEKEEEGDGDEEGEEEKEREAEGDGEGEEGEGDGEDEDPDTAGKDEPAGIEIGRFFRYKWLPSRRARQTTIQKMEMQQLQRRFEAREMADIMRSRANASSRRRRRQRSSAATASSSSSGSSSSSSSSSSSADEGESGSSSTSSSSSSSSNDDDDDNSDSSSSSSRTASARARSRRRKSGRESRKKRKREAQTDEGDGEEEEEEEEEAEGEQATKATKGKAVALSTRRRREPSGDGDQSPRRGDSKDPDSSAKPEDKSDAKEEKQKKKEKKKKEKKEKKEKEKKDKKEKKEKKKDKKQKKDKERKDRKKKKKRRKSGGEEADSASEKRSKSSGSGSKGATTAYVPFATTTKCAKCNTYNCLRACTKAMCSRCCPLDGEPCRAHADRSRRTALSSASRGTKRTSEGGATSQSRDNGGEADDDEEKRQLKKKKKKAKVEHADAEAVAGSTSTANNSIAVANHIINNNEQPGPTSSPHLKEGEAARRVRRRASSQPQAQQHRKCALCHANNYLRLCPKAMCRVCCPKDGPMCSPHALKEALKAPATATPGPDAMLRPKPEGGGSGTAAGGASSPQLPPHPEEELTGAVASSPPLAATPSPSLPSPFAHPSPTVIVTRAGDGSDRGDEAQQTARSTSLSTPAPPSPSGGGEQEEDAGEAEEEESSTNALAFFLKNAAASRSASPALDSASDALSPSSSSSSLDSILAALPSAAPPYALDLGGDQLLGVKRKHPTRCVQCNSNNALGACPKSCCSICCPKDGQRCPAHSHKRGSSSSTSTSSAPSSLRPPPAKRRNLAMDAPHSPSESSASAYAFNDAGESEILATRRVLRSEDVARPAPAAAGTQSVYRTLKCVHCNSYNMLHSCALQMCSICCHKSPRGPCAAHVRRSGEAPGALPDHHSSGAPTTPASLATGSPLVAGSAPLGGSPDLSSSDERKPKPRGRPKGSTKKKKLEDLARLMREHGQGDGSSAAPSSLSTAAAAGEGAFQPFLYPAPSLPPPPLGRRAPTRPAEASSRRAKQNTLARMRQQQWQDDDDDEDEDDDDDDVEEDDDDEGRRSNGHVRTLPSDDDDDDDDHYDDDEEEEEEYEDDDERYDEGGAIRANGAGTSLQLPQPPPPKRPRGRPRKLKPAPAAAPPLPHDLVAMTLSTFHHASDLAEGQAQQAAAAAADYHAHGDDLWRSDEPGRGRADAERVAAAAAKAEPSSDEESAGGLTHSQQEREWGGGDVPTSVEEVLVDDLLFLVCGRDHRADFVRGMAEPTFLYAPKKGAAHYARRPKRQSIRSPSGASCSNCSKPKSTSWREGWIPRGSTSPIMLCHGCGTRYGKEMYCTYCHYIYMADEDWNTTRWIGCDSCTKWIHKKCEEIHIGRVIDVKAYYQCPTCRGEIIEPPPIGAPPVAHDDTETLSD